MTDQEMFDHRPDANLGAALRGALEPRDHAAFVARVMAQYDDALRRSTVPTWEVLASWLRPGLAAAAAALAAGFLVGRLVWAPSARPDDAASFETALAPSGAGLAALVTAEDPPDPSVVFASFVDPRESR